MRGTRRSGSKSAFLKKKQQKTFNNIWPVHRIVAFCAALIDKVFLLLFVHKKKTSLCLLLLPLHGERSWCATDRIPMVRHLAVLDAKNILTEQSLHRHDVVVGGNFLHQRR